MTYELDATADAKANGTDNATERAMDDATGRPSDDGSGNAPDDGSAGEPEAGTSDGDPFDSSLGVTIPDEHVGAFVAEALEDPERSTRWDDVVDAMVAPAARAEWEALSHVDRLAAVLSKASEYDESAVESFESAPLDDEREAVQAAIDEGLRCRRNADTFRDGVAAAYGDAFVDDDELVAALDAAEFDPDLIERREDLLERIDSVYEVDFRPYGGTLMDTEESDEDHADADHSETW